ncbi:hypothetical protein Tco_0738255, partial [Tanacetum coccineum]
ANEPLRAKVSLKSDLGHMEHLEVLGQMSYLVALYFNLFSPTLLEGFLLPILLLVVIIVTLSGTESCFISDQLTSWAMLYGFLPKLRLRGVTFLQYFRLSSSHEFQARKAIIGFNRVPVGPVFLLDYYHFPFRCACDFRAEECHHKSVAGWQLNDGGILEDRVKIAGGVIGSGDEIVIPLAKLLVRSFSNKDYCRIDEIRWNNIIVRVSVELKELLPNKTGKIIKILDENRMYS